MFLFYRTSATTILFFLFFPRPSPCFENENMFSAAIMDFHRAGFLKKKELEFLEAGRRREHEKGSIRNFCSLPFVKKVFKTEFAYLYQSNRSNRFYHRDDSETNIYQSQIVKQFHFLTRSAEARVAQGWNCQRRMWRFAFIFNTTSNKHALVPKKWIQVSYILHIPPAACHQLAPAALCINVHVAGCSLVHPSRTNQVYRESNFLPAALGAVRYPTKYGSVKSINEHATSAAFQRLCAIVISRLLKRIWDIERLASLLYANV